LPATGSEPKVSRAHKLSWKEQRELEGLESRVSELEAQKAALLADMNASGSDFVRLQALAGQLNALDAELEAALERWVALSEIAEGT
jgi:ATP-binding cassette subfamily F protein uup